MKITGKILVLALLQGLVQRRLIQCWDFPNNIRGLVGSCVEIPCIANSQRNFYYVYYRTYRTVWYLQNSYNYLPIFNSRKSSPVLKDYKNRTSLVPGYKSCSLRIDPVRTDDGEKYYFPGIEEYEWINAWRETQRNVQLQVTDTPRLPDITGNSTMREGDPEIVVCSVMHTCASSPPSLKWNKPGQTESQSEDLSGGYWREILRLRYVPSYEDDRTQVECTATYHNGITSQRTPKLNIQYAPKDVTVRLTENKEPLEGSDVTLTCSSRSNPPPIRYEWYRANSKTKLRLQVQEIVVLNVSKDTEPYYCAAINNIGRGESPPIKIPVQYAPTGVQVVVLQPTGGVTELNCSFASSSPDVTHYTWIKDGNRLLNKTGQMLELDSKEDKSGSYSCIAHNTAGSSTSAELEFNDSSEDDGPNLLLILGALAGVILLLFLVVIVFFYTRRKRKPTTLPSPVHGQISSHFPTLRLQEETFMEEHQYGNIQVHPKVLPRSMNLQNSSHASEEQNFAIYSNEMPIWAETDIEYSTIAHTQSGRRQNVFNDDHQGDDINYAEILKKK